MCLRVFFGVNIPCDSVEGKKTFQSLAAELLDKKNSAAYNQAIMDHGATVCTPLAPRCKECALQEKCIALKGGRTRDVLYISGILLGDTINVFVNHWPSRRGGEAATAPLRAIAAGVSKRVIDSLMTLNPRTKAIVMGDLNDDPTDPSVVKVLEAKGDKQDVTVTGIYNPFMSFYKNGIGTLGFDDRWNLFDQIMLTGAFLHASENEWRFYKAEVFNKEFLKNSFGKYKGYPHRSFDGNTWLNGYSDHFPTLIYLIKEVQ